MTLLPTPTAMDMGRGHTVEEFDGWTDAMREKHGNGNGHGKSLEVEALRLLPTPTSGDSVGTGYATEVGQLTDANQPHRLRDAANVVRLLPTPKRSDGPNGGPGMRNGRGEADSLPGVAALLPTAMDMGRGRTPEGQTDGVTATAPAAAVRDMRAGLPSARGEDADMLTGLQSETPESEDDRACRAIWGPYAPAVRRWEILTGRPAPAPTEIGKDGRARLSPRAVEHMMGFPEGWVTDVPGVTRTNQLKVLGNAVVSAQAYLALTILTDPQQ